MLNSPLINNAALLAGRLMLAAIFVLSGYAKIGGYAGTQGYMQAMGVPGALLPVVIVVELLGGLMIAAGFQTRLTALVLAGFTLAAGFLFHFNLADQMQFINFWKNIAMTGGFLALFVAGPGAWSVDRR